jgi:hypothetical protein
MAGNAERTYLMIKPDGVQRGLVGKIIERFETRGYKLVRAPASLSVSGSLVLLYGAARPRCVACAWRAGRNESIDRIEGGLHSHCWHSPDESRHITSYRKN